MISVFEANNCLGCFITLEGTKCFSFQGTVEATFEEFNVISNKNNLENSHNIYTKIYLSDISNSKNYINEYLKDKYAQMLYILVGQASDLMKKYQSQSDYIFTNHLMVIKSENP